MSKILTITPSTKDFGDSDLFKENVETLTAVNSGTEIVKVTDITSDNEIFTVSHDITELLPPSATIYFDEHYNLSTVESGYGIAGTTNADGVFTFKPVEESGTLIPTTDYYKQFDLSASSAGIGDCFQSKVNEDEIVVYRGSDTGNAYLDFLHINVETESLRATFFCTASGRFQYRTLGEALSSTESIGVHSDGDKIRIFNYYMSTWWNPNHTMPESVVIVGVIETGAGLRFLLNNSKLYSSTEDYQNFTEQNDLSGVLPVSSSFKPCAYNSTDNYLYVLDTGTNKVYTIDLADNSKVGEITLPDAGINGIVFHKGRLTYCHGIAGSVRVSVLKNSNDA